MSIGTICIAIFFVISGLASVFGFQFENQRLVLGLLELVAGIALFAGR